MSGFARRLQQGVGTTSSSSGGGGGGGTVTHGYQITTSNTGYAAYYDSSLGRNVRSGDLTSVGTTSVASLISTYGTTISKLHLTGQLNFDTATKATFVACNFDCGINNYNGGARNPFGLSYCTIGTTSGINGYNGFAVGDSNYTMNRCFLAGGSDGFWIQGGVTSTENYVTCYGVSSSDHNDGMQASGGSGGVIVERNHFVAGGQNGVGGADSTWLIADDSTGHYTLYDNFMESFASETPAFQMRCNDGTEDVQGNWVLNGSFYDSPAFAYYGGQGDPGVTFTPGFGATRPNLVVSSNGDGTYSQVSSSGSGYTAGLIATP